MRALIFAIFCSCTATLWAAEVPEAQSSPAIKPGMVKYVSQPNGWGRTPEAAVKDLRERILPWYQKTFGDRPGFTIDWNWYALVEVSDGRMWQADGRVWWFVKKAKRPKTVRGARRASKGTGIKVPTKVSHIK
jgi:hypothetical protein